MGRVSSSKVTLNSDEEDPQFGAWVEQERKKNLARDLFDDSTFKGSKNHVHLNCLKA